MFEKSVGRVFKGIIILYVCLLIGNHTTGILNKSIDNAMIKFDGITASLLSFLRFLVNFEGAVIITITVIVFALLNEIVKHR